MLLITDHFTRFVQAFPTKSKSARCAAEKIFGEYILRFGFPKRIHHDRGGEFENKLHQRLYELSGIKSSCTTPYHPMGNGQVERMNRTFINMMKCLPSSEKNKWKNRVNHMAFAYNSTINKSTGYSPFFLMFGRSSRLPVDAMFHLEEINEDVADNLPQMVKNWKDSLDAACKIAIDNSRKSQVMSKKIYDGKVRGCDLEIGNRVLVRNLSQRGGTGKLRSYWEEKVYEVVSRLQDLPVYKITAEDGTGKIRTINRNYTSV